MKHKKIISFFLVLVLSIQLLPLKQMVNRLLSQQVTEEVQHSQDAGKSNSGADEMHKHFPPLPHTLVYASSILSAGSIQHDAEALIARHADDIPTPPPNC